MVGSRRLALSKVATSRKLVDIAVNCIPAAELATRYPMHMLTQARLTFIQLKRDYLNSRIDSGTYVLAETRLFERWPIIKSGERVFEPRFLRGKR